MSISEDQLATWSKPPSETEQEKCDNAVSAVKDAIDSHEELSSMDVIVFPQGSYRTKTNVRQNSDVDICVCLRSTFFAQYPEGKTREDYGNTEGSISYGRYKDLVEEALFDHFGEGAVVRGNKAFDIHENTYRLDADVVAAMHRRLYLNDGSDDWIRPEGIGFNTDDNDFIYNWPEQNYSKGLNKHNNTNKRYRKIVRIIKKLRDEMQEKNISGSDDIASFLIESLIWNVPDSKFNHTFFWEDVRAVLAYIFNNTRTDNECNGWYEVNGIKYLFRNGQPWTRKEAHNFISSAWDYIGFE